MFTRLTLVFVLAVIGIVVGGVFAASSGSAQAQPSQFQTANVVTFQNPDGTLSNGDLVPGGATLTRTKKGISYTFNTTQLNTGSAYTMWVVIFNRPENCVEGCDPTDLNTPAVRGSILYGESPYVTGEDGSGNFQGSVEKGLPPAGISVNIPRGTANGLIDPMTAEIHLGLHDHGPIIAGLAADQLSTFTGGCSNDFPGEWGGMRGEFFCATTQAAVFPAP